MSEAPKLSLEQRQRAQALVDSPAFDEPDDVAFELIWLRDKVARLARVAAGAGDTSERESLRDVLLRLWEDARVEPTGIATQVRDEVIDGALRGVWRVVRPAGAGESTQGGDVGPVVPAPWQVERVGEAWRAVYDRAHDVTAAWLMTEHATPGLTEKLQALSVALMTLDQRRLATFSPNDGDTFTWKARAEKAEAQLAAGDRPPAPSDAAQKLADAIIDEFGAMGLGPDHEDYTHEDYLIGLALEVRAVRPTPRAAPREPSDEAIQAAISANTPVHPPHDGWLWKFYQVALRAAYAVDFGAAAPRDALTPPSELRAAAEEVVREMAYLFERDAPADATLVANDIRDALAYRRLQRALGDAARPEDISQK